MRLRTLIQGAPLLVVIALLAGYVNPVHPRFGGPPTEGMTGIAKQGLDGAWVIGCLIADYPVVFLSVVGIWMFVRAIRFISSKMPVTQDPQRMYTNSQRQMGFLRASGVCELDGWLWFRCRRPASHGDHWFPWSRGGATDMANFVAACATCNLSKGARIPTRIQTGRVQRRRSKYFPADIPRKAGNKVGAPQ